MYNTIALERRSSESLVHQPVSTKPKATFRFPPRHEGQRALLATSAPVPVAPISGRGGCFNCQGAHRYLACPQCSVCLPCNSTSHACWAFNCPARSRWESSRGVKARVSVCLLQSRLLLRLPLRFLQLIWKLWLLGLSKLGLLQS